MIKRHDRASWHVQWMLEKFHGDRDAFDSDEAFRAACERYEVIKGKGNLLVNTGIQLLEDLLIGAGGTTFANANAYIGVGDSTTAAAASQTDLQASTNKLRKAMDATYPSRSSQTVTWRATFGTSDANFAWQEWAIFNASSSGTMLNRKVESLGTKVSGSSWAFTVTVTIS